MKGMDGTNGTSGMNGMSGINGIKWKERFLASLKIAGAAVAAIAAAGELGLKYSATAGIITVLSIQNTKRETFKSAANRGLAFLCALALGAACFRILGYSLWGFAAYLLVFAMVCLWAGWREAIAMDSVLVTHFLAERSMAPGMLANEALLFLIGTGMGILVNLHLHRKDAEFARLAGEADSQIRGILRRMSLWLRRQDRSGYAPDCFGRLETALEEAGLCAAQNYNNAMRDRDTYELDYMKMRERQSVILREIYENIRRMGHLPPQAEQVAALLERIERDYHRDNTVEGLMGELEELLARMKEEKLPESREEFEARAILFYILMQIRGFLEVKRGFMEECGKIFR